MYKVFFNDRILFLTDNFTKHFQQKYGLFYKYSSLGDLRELIDFFSRLTSIDTSYIFHSDIDELRNSFRDCFIDISAAGGLVRNSVGEYLLIYRRGKWDLPKGKLDKGELFENAALREVEEECGITHLEIVRPLLSTYHTYPYKNGIALKKTSWFEMLYSGNTAPVPQTSEDISQVKWVKYDELGFYLRNTYAAIRDVFEYYGLGQV